MGISLKEVSYSYDIKRKKKKFALVDISLEIEKNDEFIAIIGETGSGKSTLVSMFNALKIPTSGSLEILGVKITKKPKRKDNYNNLRKHVGLVFQFSDYQLFEDTIIKDVMFAPLNFKKSSEEALSIAKKSLELVGLSKETYEKSPFTISGGEKKLASIAGILAMEPEILIFDEPTAGLDPETKKRLENLLKDLNEKEHKSIVIVTHDMNTVLKYAKRVLVLKDKGIVFDGTPKDLFKNRLDLVKSSHIDLPDALKIRNYLIDRTDLTIDDDIKDMNNLLDEVLKNA